jgi:hypothetical protein
MKKVYALIVFSVFLASVAGAQNFYARVGTGMSIQTASDLTLMYDYDESSSTVSTVPVGFGTGYHLNAAFGYMIKKYLGVELGVTKFFGFNNQADAHYLLFYMSNSGTGSKMKGNMLYFTPAVILTPGLEKVNPYMRVGMNMGVLSNIISNYTFTDSYEGFTTDYEVTEKYTGGLAMGFNAACGVDWNITSLITLFAEVNFNGISWAPKKSEITQYEENGEDMLSSLTEKQKVTEYSRDVNLDETIPDTDPNQGLLYNFPFSNAGMIVGIKFRW